MKLLACKHGSSTPQPIPSCRRPSFSRLSDHKDSSLDRQSSALPHDHQLGLGSVLQFYHRLFLTPLRASPPATMFCVSSLSSNSVMPFHCELSRPSDPETSVSSSQYSTTPPPNPDLLRTYLTVLSSAVLTPPRVSPPASVFCASSLTGAVCEYSRLEL